MIYQINYFDSKNTCVNGLVEAKNNQEVREKMIKLSDKFNKIIINNQHGWEQIENGEKTEWSYPSGLNCNA